MIEAVLTVLFLFAILMGISWGVTCVIIKLITLCFGWTFSLPIATGIWLILCLLSMTIFKSDKKK